MRRANDGHTWRDALTALVCTAATVVGACAGGGGDGGYTSVQYGYGGVYYASAWNDPWYQGGPVYVGPPAGRPPARCDRRRSAARLKPASTPNAATAPSSARAGRRS